MDQSKSFTVFIPTVGRLKYIREAIASAQAQTYADIEILIGDERSNDGTAAFLQELCGRDSRVRFYRTEEMLGMPGNWQKGLELASGRWITILSDDDLLKPTFVERCVAEFLESPDTQVIATLHEVIDADGLPVENITRCRAEFFTAQLAAKTCCGVIDTPPMMSCALATSWARRFGFARHAGFAADVDFFRRAGISGYNCRLLEEFLVSYRVHLGATSAVGVIGQAFGNIESLLRIEADSPSVVRVPGWSALRDASVFSAVHWLVRGGRRRDALNVLLRLRRWVYGATLLKLLIKVVFGRGA